MNEVSRVELSKAERQELEQLGERRRKELEDLKKLTGCPVHKKFVIGSSTFGCELNWT